MAKVKKKKTFFDADTQRIGNSVSALLKRSKFIHIRINEMVVHPVILQNNITMEYPPDHPIIKQQSDKSITNIDLIRSYLIMFPIVVTRHSEDRRWYVVARVRGLYTSRMYLSQTERIPVMEIAAPSDTQIMQLLTQDLVINPILDNTYVTKQKNWQAISKLEQIGALGTLGLAGLSKRIWARWLKCDPRSIHEKN